MYVARYVALAVAALIAGCSTSKMAQLDPAIAKLSDKELLYSAAMIGAFNELRCGGLGPKRASVIYERRFGERERRIRSGMIAKYGPPKEGEGDLIPIGKKCSAYHGAGRQYDAALTELERRLGIPHN